MWLWEHALGQEESLWVGLGFLAPRESSGIKDGELFSVISPNHPHTHPFTCLMRSSLSRPSLTFPFSFLQSSSCFYSKDPFVEWLPCLPRELQLKPPIPKVITFLVDQDQRSGVSLVLRKVRTQSRGIALDSKKLLILSEFLFSLSIPDDKNWLKENYPGRHNEFVLPLFVH